MKKSCAQMTDKIKIFIHLFQAINDDNQHFYPPSFKWQFIILYVYYNLDFFIPSNPSHMRSLCFPVALPNPGTNAFDSPSYGRTWNAPSWNGWQTYGKKSELVGGGLSLSSSPGATSTPFKRTRDGPLYQSRICDGALLGAKFSFDTKQIKNQKKIKYFLKTQSCVIRTTCSLIWNVGMTHGE